MDPIKLSPHEFVRIYWQDSSYKKGWQYPVEEKRFNFSEELVEASSVGWVVDCAEGHLALAASLTDDGAALNPLFVPWGAITLLKRLDHFDTEAP